MEQLGMVVGIVMMLAGIGYLFKAYIAIVQGRLWYFSGFLPLTLISPWFVFTPPDERKKNSLSKVKDAIWVPIFFGPIFVICSVLCLSAGGDLANLPGTATTNRVLTSWTSDKTPVIVFDKKHYKMQFPAVVKTANKIAGMFFGGRVIMKEQDKLLLPDGG